MHLPHAPLVRRLLGAVELDVELTRAVVHHLHLVVRHKSSRCGGRGTRGRARAGRGARAHNSQQHARKAAAAWGAVWSATQAQRVARGTRQPHGERGEHGKYAVGMREGLQGAQRRFSRQRRQHRKRGSAPAGAAALARGKRPPQATQTPPHALVLGALCTGGVYVPCIAPGGSRERRSAQPKRAEGPSVHKGPCACTQQRVLRAPPAPPAQLAKSGAG